MGVLSPILTRRNKNRLQILAGHNRWQAAILAGLSQIPALILDADDDQAILILTSTNLRQREHLLPSEKAFAYKMQMEALKRQGQRGVSSETYEASSFITQQTGDSRMQIHRYVRLTELDPNLLGLLDKGKISMTPAVSVSYLCSEDQREVFRCVKNQGASLTIDKANRLRGLASAGGVPVGDLRIREILFREMRKKKQTEMVSIRFESIREFLPPDMVIDDVEAWLVGVLRGRKA